MLNEKKLAECLDAEKTGANEATTFGRNLVHLEVTA